MNKKIQDALNEQIQAEMYSSYLYLSMSNYCKTINLNGIATWFSKQAGEEWAHAMKFYDYVIERGGSVVFETINKPPHDFKNVLGAFEATLAHEKEVTARIHKIYEIALKENDYPSQIMLHWFITEQVEEEATASEIIQKIKLIGDKGSSIFWLDKDLGKRE